MGDLISENYVFDQLSNIDPQNRNPLILLDKILCKLDEIHGKMPKKIKIKQINLITTFRDELVLVKHVITIRK